MIPFVYFDLGGVVDLDFSKTDKWEKLKREWGITLDKDEEFEKFWDSFESEACTGRNIEELLPILKEKYNFNPPLGYSILLDGFVNRFEINKFIWPVIDKIRKYCKVGLLTNMYSRMYEEIKKRRIIPDINWDAIIDSSVEGVQKPDPAIFKLAEEKAGVKGNKILFVENSPGHIKVALSFGWQTFLYDPSNSEKSGRELLVRFSIL